MLTCHLEPMLTALRTRLVTTHDARELGSEESIIALALRPTSRTRYWPRRLHRQTQRSAGMASKIGSVHQEMPGFKRAASSPNVASSIPR